MTAPAFRFAPSPNGYLHLGHAYSAALNAAMARDAGGRFLLRIEDIDATRCRPEYEAAIFDDLRWLGLAWEEPVRRQSQHLSATPTRWRASFGGLIYPSSKAAPRSPAGRRARAQRALAARPDARRSIPVPPGRSAARARAAWRAVNPLRCASTWRRRSMPGPRSPGPRPPPAQRDRPMAADPGMGRRSAARIPPPATTSPWWWTTPSGHHPCGGGRDPFPATGLHRLLQIPLVLPDRSIIITA